MMSKHYRQSCYDDGQDWMQITEPGQLCNGCGKDFHADVDNQHRYANGAVVFYCDRCMKLGAHERIREYERHE